MTSRKFIGRPIMTADNSDPPAIIQGFAVADKRLLRVVRATIVIYNDPAFTSVSMALYAKRGSSAVKKIATSTNSRTKSELITLDHGFKQTYFEFNSIPLQASETYFLGLIFAGYTGDQSSHCAWASSWPDPEYFVSFDEEQKNAAKYPVQFSLIDTEV